MPTKRKEVKNSSSGQHGPVSVFNIPGHIRTGKEKRNCVARGGTWDNQAGKCK